MINEQDWDKLSKQFNSSEPFKHVTIDDFFTKEIADRLVNEFPKDYDSPVWSARYNNPIEKKKTSNHWDSFPPATYKVFDYLCTEFHTIVERISGIDNVKADIGLHGGGWHCHKTGDKLNVHFDYSIHPKLNLERHFNLIVYMTPNWETDWGGGLELWSHNPETNNPLECVKTIENKFNRAVIFDTTKNAWHGLPKPIMCPEGVNRQSLAIYYLTEPSVDANPRAKALFAPYEEQSNQPEILDFIKQRSQNYDK